MAPQRPEDAFVRMPEHEFEAILARADGVLPGVVGAVGKPQLESLRAGCPHDVDALEVVGDGLGANPFVGVGQ